MKKLFLLTATILSFPVAFTSVARAEYVSGVYVGAGVGANFTDDTTVRLGTGHATARGTERFDPGFSGVGSVGYGFGNGVRVEIEGDYRRNDIHQFRSLGLNPSRTRGLSEQAGAMANILYDFDLKPYGISFVTPYLGAGAGYQWDMLSGAHATNANRGFRVTDADGAFAYQGIAGLAFPLAVPGLSLTTEYRFMGTTEPMFGATQYAGATSSNARFNQRENYNHTALIGLRYAFDAPPPSPTTTTQYFPTPSANLARTYIVFFDWDRSDLSTRARQIVADAAQASTHVKTTRIEVTGYTDRSGPVSYNQDLSIRRARIVEAELVKDGVPQEEIDIQGFGENHPLVPTADGVREARNRRVEIVLK